MLPECHIIWHILYWRYPEVVLLNCFILIWKNEQKKYQPWFGACPVWCPQDCSLFSDDLVLLASLTSNEPTLRRFETVWGAFVMWFLTFKSVVKLLCHKTLDSLQSVVVGLKSTGLSICENGGTLEAGWFISFHVRSYRLTNNKRM